MHIINLEKVNIKGKANRIIVSNLQRMHYTSNDILEESTTGNIVVSAT